MNTKKDAGDKYYLNPEDGRTYLTTKQPSYDTLDLRNVEKESELKAKVCLGCYEGGGGGGSAVDSVGRALLS